MGYRWVGNFRCLLSSVDTKKLTDYNAAIIGIMLEIHLKPNSILEAKAETWKRCLLNGVNNANELALFSRCLYIIIILLTHMSAFSF